MRRHVGDFCLLHSKRVALYYDDELGGLFEIPICAMPATAFLDGVSTCIWDGKEMKCGALSDSMIWAGMKGVGALRGKWVRVDVGWVHRMSAMMRWKAHQIHWNADCMYLLDWTYSLVLHKSRTRT